MQKIKFENGTILEVLGNKYIIEQQEALRGATCFYENKILVFGFPEYLAKKVSLFLKEFLTEQIYILVNKYTQIQNVKYSKISVKDLSSRWGSCSSTGNLSFNLRLVFLPLEMLEYVVAHEVCHLIEMNHSNKFWLQVAKLNPHYKKIRASLKTRGKNAFSYSLE
jgi:predicted metal-dependent hydrolase